MITLYSLVHLEALLKRNSSCRKLEQHLGKTMKQRLKGLSSPTSIKDKGLYRAREKEEVARISTSKGKRDCLAREANANN